jgi:hypothetical protein
MWKNMAQAKLFNSECNGWQSTIEKSSHWHIRESVSRINSAEENSNKIKIRKILATILSCEI